MSAQRGKAKPGNRIFRLLPASEQRLIASKSQTVELKPGQVICKLGENPRYVYFPHSGTVALFGSVVGGYNIGAGLIQADGVFGTAAAFRTARSNLLATSVGIGRGSSIDAGTFAALLECCPGLQNAVFKYVHETAFQLVQNIACLALHSSRQRLARLLIDISDAQNEPSFASTQVMIGSLIGLQRPAVSYLAADLQRSGLIRYVRGQVTILDRSALAAAACDCTRRKQRL